MSTAVGKVPEHQAVTPENASKTTLDRLWDRLDAQTNLLMEDASVDKTYTKGLARGIAICIWEMTSLYYETDKHVVIEALRRYNERKGIVEPAPTPGYGLHSPMPTPTKYEVIRKGTSPKDMAPPAVSEEDAAAIRDAFNSGKFTLEKIAKVFGCSEDQVKKITASLL